MSGLLDPVKGWWNKKDNNYQALFLSWTGVACLSLGVIFFSLCDDWRSSDDTYDSQDVTGFVFGTLLSGIGCLSLIFGFILLEFGKNVRWLGIFSGVMFVGSIIILCSMEGYIYISWNEVDFDSSNTSSIETLVSFCEFLVWLTFCIVGSMLMYRVWFLSKLNGQPVYQWPNNGTNVHKDESSPLLKSGNTENKNGKNEAELINENDNDTKNKNNNDNDNDSKNEAGNNESKRKEEESKSKDENDSEYDYIPTAYERSIRCSNSDFACLCFVALLLPLLFFIVSFLPSSYVSYLPIEISEYASDGGTSDDASNNDNWIIYVTINNGSSTMTIYLETLFYYVLCILLCSASYLSRKSLWFRIEMRRLNYLPFNIGAVSQARSLISGFIILLSGLWFFYFGFIYNYETSDWAVSSTSFAGWLMRFARGMGKVSMLLLSLLLLSIAGRTSDIWLSVFGMSYDNMIIYHKKISNSFIWMSLLHILLFLIAWAVDGTFWDNLIFSNLPLECASDNFTVSVMWYLLFLLFIPCIIVLSWNKRILKDHYTIFYYGHIVGGLTVTCVLLWHGTGSWYIVLPSVILYYFDALIGFYKQTRQCHIRELKLSDSLPNNLIELSIGFDEIFGDETKHNLGNNQLFEFGMFIYVKIWQVSRFEWRAFRIVECSSQNGVAKVLVWADNEKGSLSWSNKLHELTLNLDENMKESLNVSVCGPYGEPLIVDSYRKILLIAEEMGITSMIGFFSYMLEKAIAEATQVSVDLIFIGNNPNIFLQFEDIFSLYSKHFDGNSERLFDVRLFYRLSSSNDDAVAKIEEKVGLTLEEGSPDLVKELQYLEGLGTFTLIIVNGSEAVIRQSERVAVRFGAHFRSDRNTFI